MCCGLNGYRVKIFDPLNLLNILIGICLNFSFNFFSLNLVKIILKH